MTNKELIELLLKYPDDFYPCININNAVFHIDGYKIIADKIVLSSKMVTYKF